MGLVRPRCLGRAAEVIPSSFVRYIPFRVLRIRGAVLLSRVGMLRLGLFGWLLPAICATVVTQLFRTLFHQS